MGWYLTHAFTYKAVTTALVSPTGIEWQLQGRGINKIPWHITLDVSPFHSRMLEKPGLLHDGGD